MCISVHVEARQCIIIINSIPQTNTYQGVLVTDGVQSYALFTYKCGEMEWSGGATIGFGANDELYANLRLSGSSQANAVACLNSPTTEWSNLLYKLTDDPGTTGPCAHKLY